MNLERWTERTFRRAAVVRIYDVADRTVVLAPEGEGHALAGDSAELARAVLAFLDHPRTGAEVLGHIEALAGGPIERPAVIEELLRLLLRARAVEVVDPNASRPAPRGPGPRVVLGVTGAVATMHAPALVQRLQARGFEVRVAATESALRFVRAEALEALTHRPVVHAIWPIDQVHVVPHIELAEWADAVVVCPASATTIARLGTGDHSSVVAAIALATRAPVVVAPSMNPAMYASPAVQRNLARLIEDGIHVVHPGRGLEVADRPDQRAPMLGGAPPPEVVTQILAAILHARAGALVAAAPRSGDAWDRLYRHHDVAALPWQTDVADPDMIAALEREGPGPLPVLDIGAGLGTLALAAAGRGHTVVATDLSAVALERARERADGAPVIWLHDDITDTRLRSRFRVVMDRGCLHLLTGDDVTRYAAAVARLVAPGGCVILKTFAAAAAGVTPYTAEQIGAVFGAVFEIEHEAASTMPGSAGAPAARLFVLRRRAEGHA